MNPNILKKIIDRVALNKWRNKMKKCGKEYESLFYINCYNILRTVNCHSTLYFSYFYRAIGDQDEDCKVIYHADRSICALCGHIIFKYHVVCKLPKNYW